MIIRADKEGLDSVKALCDIALRAGGVQNLPGINNVLSNLHLLPPPPQEPNLNKPAVSENSPGNVGEK